MSNDITEIVVMLISEGTLTYRSTPALHIDGQTYQLLAAPDYDPSSETWQFLPDTVVRCAMSRFASRDNQTIEKWLAVERVGKPMQYRLASADGKDVAVIDQMAVNSFRLQATKDGATVHDSMHDELEDAIWRAREVIDAYNEEWQVI